MTKLGEVFAVPVRAKKGLGPYWVVQDANGQSISGPLTEPQALALAEAINTHDRMREAVKLVNRDMDMPGPLPGLSIAAMLAARAAREGEKRPCTTYHSRAVGVACSDCGRMKEDHHD